MYCPHGSNDQGNPWVKEEGNLLCQNSQFYYWCEHFLPFLFWVWVCNSSSVLTPRPRYTCICVIQGSLHRVFPLRRQPKLLLLSLLQLLLCRPAGFWDLPMKHVSFLPVSTLTRSFKNITKRVDYEGSANSVVQQGKDKWLWNVMLSKGLVIVIICCCYMISFSCLFVFWLKLMTTKFICNRSVFIIAFKDLKK